MGVLVYEAPRGSTLPAGAVTDACRALNRGAPAGVLYVVLNGTRIEASASDPHPCDSASLGFVRAGAAMFVAGYLARMVDELAPDAPRAPMETHVSCAGCRWVGLADDLVGHAAVCPGREAG